jgi:hypothetical protein
MRRWLVALALTVVATHGADADGLTIETQRRTVKSTNLIAATPSARIAQLPASLELPGSVIAAVDLTDHLIAIERLGTLDIVDRRDGRTVGTTTLTGQGIQTVSRSYTGDLHLKTHGDLIAIERDTGRVRWAQRTTSIGNVAAMPDAIVDSWVDRETHRFGIVTYDPVTGRRLDSIELGATGGWYDREHVELAMDGPREVVVSAMFAVA